MTVEAGDHTPRRALVLRLLDDVAAGEVSGVRRLPGGNFGEVWRAETSSGPVVVRFCPTRPGPSSYEREQRVLRALEGSDLPMPRLLAVNAEHGVLVLTALPGETACATGDPEAVAASAGRLLADLHAHDLDENVPDAVEAMEHQVSEWAAKNPGAHDLHQVALERERDTAPEQPVVVHGDFWTGNLLWSGTEVTGVVDWERSGRGCRGQDVAKMRLDLAMLFGLNTASHFRREYEKLADVEVPNAGYWDARVAIDGYPDPGRWWLPTYRQLGYTHLTADGVRQRFAAYVHAVTHSSARC